MTGLVRKASILAVLGLVLVAAAAFAGIPDPAHCICPGLSNGHYWVNIIACRTGVIDPYGVFTVYVADAAGNPVPGCDVKLCTSCPDIKFSQIAGVACVPQCITAVSDAAGNATFDLAGAAINTNGVATGCGFDGATIYACNVLLCNVSMCVFDENGAASSPGVEITDVSAFMGDLSKPIGYKARSDFNHLGTVEITDLSFLLKRLGLSTSKDRCAIYCP